jgi:cation-transporting ATPase 13A1
LDTPAEGSKWQWKSVDKDLSMDLFLDEIALPRRKRDIFASKFELCLTGSALEYLSSTGNINFLHEILPHVRVFARMSPKQKEQVITALKSLGYHTLMCGDG